SVNVDSVGECGPRYGGDGLSDRRLSVERLRAEPGVPFVERQLAQPSARTAPRQGILHQHHCSGYGCVRRVPGVRGYDVDFRTREEIHDPPLRFRESWRNAEAPA